MDSFEDGHSWICFRFVDGRTEGSNAEGRRKAIGWIKTRPAIRRYSDHLLLALLKARALRNSRTGLRSSTTSQTALPIPIEGSAVALAETHARTAHGRMRHGG